MANQFPEFTPVKFDDNFWIIEQNGVRCFLFEGDDIALLVDAGFGGDLEAVCKKLTDKPIQLILTHADGDHVGAHKQFGPVMMHPAEFSYFETRNGSMPQAIPVWEGEKIDIGTFCFEVVLISGHTPGSIALLEREKRFIITGDTVGTVPVFMFGAGRNLPAYLASIRKLKAMQDSFDIIHPSHGKGPLGKAVLTELCLLAADILAGKWPQPQQPEMTHLPPAVKVYGRDGIGFLMEKK